MLDYDTHSVLALKNQRLETGNELLHATSFGSRRCPHVSVMELIIQHLSRRLPTSNSY